MREKTTLLILLFLSLSLPFQAFAGGIEEATAELYEQMEDKAKEIGSSAHPASKIEDTRLTSSEVVQKGPYAADVYTSYVVYMKGVFFGINKFSVGVDVTGYVKRNKDGSWATSIKGSHKTFDSKR